MRRVFVTAALLLGACTLHTQPEETTPGTEVDFVDRATDPDSADEYEEMRAALAESESWSTDDFLEAHSPEYLASLPYEPLEAEFLDLVDASSFALDEDERGRLATDGFVMTDDAFPSFVYGMQTIYMEDLPVYVTADSILFAMHRSYDAMLATIERRHLVDDLTALIDGMRSRLRAGAALGLTAEQENDLDLYLAVAGTLLNPVPRPPLVGASQTTVDAMVERALEASESEERVLYGQKRKIDWSQFKPRGHYAGDEVLERYFRAMMWLGRIDFRMLEPDEANGLVFHRRQFYDVIALYNLLDTTTEPTFQRMHDTIGAFVGEPDGFVVTQVRELLDVLGVEDATGTKGLSDNDIAVALQKHGFGSQRISSHFMVNGIGGTKPLASSAALFGQRYVLDAHVFSNVVYDRVRGGNAKRMMPDPLDVAFAALGNDAAAHLLEQELRQYDYQHDLEAMRILADAHTSDYWAANLYNRWLAGLRALSPLDEALPSVAHTEAWGRRLLTTQLASWAELRHDTILYAKQSYTGGAVCEFPDAYVDPYPAFYAAVADFATTGNQAVSWTGDSEMTAYFERLREAAERLERMATAQQAGNPHDDADLAWINEAVVMEPNCDGTSLGATGWYGELFYSGRETDFDPTIADVHTQPTDAAGDTVGRVLHVATGLARGIVVTVETCVGPRAYVGLSSTYYEVFTENFERLDDASWAPVVMSPSPVPPEWSP